MTALKHSLLTLVLLTISHFSAAQEVWKIYSSYSNPTQAVKVGSKTYVVCDGALFSHDADDDEVTTYDKANNLSDFGIRTIAKYGTNLIVLYSNGNLDILSADGETYNMVELKNKSLDDKTFNQMRVFGKEAAISSNSGLIIADLYKRSFSTFYKLGKTILGCIIQDGKIYAKTKSSVLVGDRTKNLLDIANWTEISFAEAKKVVDFDAMDLTEKQENETLLKEIAEYKPDGPETNYTYRLGFEGDRLLIAGGCFNYPEVNRTGTVMTCTDGKWDMFEREGAIKANPQEFYYRNITDVVQDPSDDTHHFASAACSGLYEFRDGKFVKHYTYGKNSPLQSILPDDTYSGYYVRVTGLKYDSDGNLWMLNNGCDTIIREMKHDGSWSAHYYPEIAGYPTLDQIHFGQNGWIWVNSRRSTSQGHKAGVLVIDKANNRHTFITSVVNQNGTSYTDKVTLVNCITEDLNGAIWVGTNQGPFEIQKPADVFNSDFRYYQVTVPRNDGTNLADYLLNEVAIKCIAVDGGNRKWFGTSSNGVYLTSADGTEIIHHFTKDNSPLISDEIYSIAIDGRTGEVFIGTSQGLCSFMGDATDPVAQYDDNKVITYPNPVTPEYTGNIKITGLELESHVRIVNAAGRLVSKGVSTGGSYVWNGRLSDGKKAQSGVYFILATNAEGDESVAGKFVIVR